MCAFVNKTECGMLLLYEHTIVTKLHISVQIDTFTCS